MKVTTWLKDRNELLGKVLWQVKSVHFLVVQLSLPPLLYAFLLTVGRCSSSEPWVCISATIHLPEENKLQWG